MKMLRDYGISNNYLFYLLGANGARIRFLGFIFWISTNIEL